MATLDAHLDSFAASQDGPRAAVAATVRALAAAAVALHGLLLEAGTGSFPEPADGAGNALPAAADTLFGQAARAAPVAVYAAREAQRPAALVGGAGLALAAAALSGPAGVGTSGAAPGSLFSILPASCDSHGDSESAFRQPGRNQLAAGLFVHGHPLTLLLTLKGGTQAFAFSPRLGGFVQTAERLAVAARADHIAVDMSGRRHWPDALRLYVDDCLEGADGPRERDFTVGWSASPLAEAQRILRRGGVFLLPAAWRAGRNLPRLVHEANPLALLAEEAGGAASDTAGAILDRVPEGLDERTPLVFGAAREVARIVRCHAEPSPSAERAAERAPLFGHRGLFRR